MIEEVDDSELKILEQEYITMLEPNLNSYKAYQTEEEHKEQIRLHNNIKSNCPECGKEMLKNNIKKHIRNNHK